MAVRLLYLLDGVDPEGVIDDMENKKPDDSLTFEQELSALLNKHSKENDSDTPDFVLACFLN